MHPDAPYFIILLCLMPDDFTHQGESAATQWVNITILCVQTFIVTKIMKSSWLFAMDSKNLLWQHCYF
jgi:hypothetical protein